MVTQIHVNFSHSNVVIFMHYCLYTINEYYGELSEYVSVILWNDDSQS